MKRKINKQKVAIHVLAWVAAFFINLILGSAFDPVESLVTWLLYLLVFYVNYLLLIPKLFRHKRFVLYVLSALAVLGLSFLALRNYSAQTAARRTSDLFDRMSEYDKDVRDSFEQKTRMQERQRWERWEEGQQSPPPAPQPDSLQLPEADSLPPAQASEAAAPVDTLASNGAAAAPVLVETAVEEIAFTPLEEDYGRVRGEYNQARRIERNFERAAYNPFDPFNMRFVFALVFFYMASVVVFFIEQSALNERRRRELEKEKATAELAYLKQQINPHFLFNTLNAIYSYTIGVSAPAADAVLKLSSILRYMLYQTGRDQVPLADELTVMDDYIELQKLRLTDKTKVEVRIGGDTRNRLIEPMLLIPIVENAFKFGADSVQTSFIRIELDVESCRLTFRTTNRIVQRSSGDRSSSGIGIRNIRRRLDLSYGPGNYLLEAGEKGDVFTVILQLKLR